MVRSHQDTLRDALQITPVNNNNAFSSHPSSDALINFVNDLVYPKVVRNLSNIVTNDMFQPWRELTTIIILFLTGKTSGFERPRAPVLQILWGSKHKFHPIPDSPLHLPNEEPILGYLMFCAKGTKQEVFEMPIPGNLITVDIQGEPYYKEYQDKVSKHQRYLAGEKRSDPNSPAPNPAKASKKSKPSAPKADLRPPVTKPASSQQLEPKPASAKSVDESVDEGIPEKEPRFDDEEIVRWNLMRICHGLMREFKMKARLDQTLENLKLTVKEQVILEEPTSSTGTLSYLQHLAKDLSFGDLFFNDKPSKADNEKTTIETEAESMVSVTIQQDTSSIPPMTTPIIDLTSRPDSPNVHRPLQATTTKTTTTTTTTHPPPPQPQQSTTDSMLMKRIDELEQIMANLIQDNKHLEERLDSHGARLYTLENLDIPQDLPEVDMKESLHQRIWETNSYKTHKDHMMLYEALEKSMNRNHIHELLKDLAEAYKKKKKIRDSPKMPPRSPPYQPPPPPPPAGPSGTSGSPGAFGSSQVPPPPPPPPSTNQEGHSHGSIAPSSSKTAASVKYKAGTITDTKIRLPVSSTPEDLHMDDDMSPDAQAHLCDDEDIRNAHIPMVNLRQDWWKPLEEDRHATPEPAWSIPSSDVPVPKNNWASTLVTTYSPLPKDLLLAQPGDMAMFMEWFCKRQGITKLKPQDLEGPAFKLVKVFHPNITIQSDFFFNKDSYYLRYDSKGSRHALLISKIKAAYYPNVGLEQMVPDQIHTSKGDRRAVRTHIRNLSVVRIEVFSMYGQHVEDFQLGIKSYQTQLNLTKPRWDATGFEYKHDYTVIVSSRAITFHDIYEVQMIMWFNEIHKFSDGTLHQIDEALDYRVKVFKVNRMNPVDIEKVVVCSSLRSLKPKCTIESRANRSSKIISLGHYSIMLASSYTVKSKTDIKSPTHYPRGIARTSE
nr:hypothetical protein [Tanacetum cinerariifolium]